MILRFFFLFALIPAAELYLLIKVGRIIGAPSTVALVLLISLAGAWLVRYQGFEILRRIQTDLSQGRLPAAELLDGAMILAGGMLMLSPGFFTDIAGLFFLFPPTRALIKQYVRRRLQQKMSGGVITIRRF